VLRQALAIHERGDSSSPAASSTRLRLADLLSQDKDAFAEAEALYLRAVADLRARLGPNHPRVIYATNDYAGNLIRSGHPAPADSIYSANLTALRRLLSPDHTSVTYQVVLRISALNRMGRYSESEPLARQVIATYKRTTGIASSEYTGALGWLAQTLTGQGRLREADSLARLGIEIRRRIIGEDASPLYALSLAGWAGILTAERAYPKADSLYQQALDIMLRYTSEQHRDVRRIHAGLARLYDAWGRPDQAATHHRIAGPYVIPY
jgi:tetratricopeptide (TPR) repeat protein